MRCSKHGALNCVYLVCARERHNRRSGGSDAGLSLVFDDGTSAALYESPAPPCDSGSSGGYDSSSSSSSDCGSY